MVLRGPAATRERRCSPAVTPRRRDPTGTTRRARTSSITLLTGRVRAHGPRAHTTSATTPGQSRRTRTAKRSRATHGHAALPDDLKPEAGVEAGGGGELIEKHASRLVPLCPRLIPPGGRPSRCCS